MTLNTQNKTEYNSTNTERQDLANGETQTNDLENTGEITGTDYEEDI